MTQTKQLKLDGEPTPEEFLLHYVGSGLYGVHRFIAESRKIGVQRAIRFDLLRYVKWGQPILLAENKKVPICNKKYHDIPNAVVFGYFRVNSLSYQLDPDVQEKLVSKIEVLDIIQPQSSSGDMEQRACGSYSVGATYLVSDSIEDIVQKIVEACEECGKDVNDFKYFLKGDVKVLDTPRILNHTKFNRGYRKVSIEGLDLEKEVPKKAISFLYNYTRRMYMKKEDGEEYDRMLADEVAEETT